MEKAFIGYHGTQKCDAQEILRTRYFKFSIDEEEWLGDGIYFFEDDIKQAYYFATKARGYNPWAIIKCNIISNEDSIIDLTKTEQVEQFERIAKSIKDKYKKRKDGSNRELLNSVILNMMYKIKPYQLVRAAFPVPKKNQIIRTNIIPIHIQLCVRSRECIKTFEEVEYNGYEAIC